MGNVVTCGPNTALVVSGGRESTIRIGGRAVVFPCIQRVDRLSLELRTLNVRSVNATTLQGVRICVEGIAQVKVSGYSYVAHPSRVSLCVRVVPPALLSFFFFCSEMCQGWTVR